MNSRTKKILIASFILLFGALGACTFLTLQIKSAGSKLATYTEALNEKNAKEAAFIRVNRIVQETETDRESLDTAFFADEGASISFLGNLETFASSVGIELKTEGLDKIISPDGKREYITMTFVYSGRREAVLTFTKLLEEVPYHSTVASLFLRNSTDAFWEGRLTLLVSILPS
jgi:hypothetical protein